MALNRKQQTFADEYLVDMNATQAAIRAGYSEKTAYSQGQRLSKHVEVASRVRELQDERAERTEVTQDRVIRELAKLGFSDIRELATWDEDGVKWESSSEIPAEAAAAVKDVMFTRTVRRDKNGDEVTITETALKLHDKRGSLKLLGDHLGVFDSTGGDIGKLADTFLAGADTMRKAQEVEDLSED